MPQDLSRLAEAMLSAATKAGAETADAIAVDGTTLNIEVRNGALEQAERAEGVDLGLRVLIGQRQACVSISDASDDAIAEMAARAVAMAREAPEDPHIGLADPAQLAQQTDMSVLDVADPADAAHPADLQEAAMAAEAAALAVAGVSQVENVGAGQNDRTIHLATTDGFSAGYRRTDSHVFCVAITGEGTSMERDYFGEGRVYRADLPGPEEIGRIAGERTVARAGARKPPTGSFPVLYDERIAGSLVGHILGAINGRSIVRGASWLRDAMGEDVLPKGMSLTEHPHRVRISGSRIFDGEGLATADRSFIEDGILKSWVLDLASARNLGLDSTANGSRGLSDAPAPGTSNIALTQGTASREDLIRDMGTGLLVTSMIGATISPTTGDYSRGANGFWVENGEIAYPVNECTVAGNLRDMLRTLVPANDARTHMSRVVPSLLVEGLTLAGA